MLLLAGMKSIKWISLEDIWNLGNNEEISFALAKSFNITLNHVLFKPVKLLISGFRITAIILIETVVLMRLLGEWRW